MGDLTTLRARVEVVGPDRIRATMLEGQRSTPELRRAIAEAKPTLLQFPGVVEFQDARGDTGRQVGGGRGVC